MRTRKKRVKGQEYYYLEETIRLDKPKAYSIFLGKTIPKNQKPYEKKLENKIYADLLGEKNRIYISKRQLIEVEKHRRRHKAKTEKNGKARQDEQDEIASIDFVFTTLTTEGVPITRQDANLAYRIAEKGAIDVRDENLRIALGMMKGLRLIKETPKGLDKKFILNLHGTIMSEYGEKHPGKYRTRPAKIYLKSQERSEEVAFKPAQPMQIPEKTYALIKWYNENCGKLNAIELAAILHLRIYQIHPFDDGNKRMSRLLLNKAFFDNGYPILNISQPPEPYFDTLINSVESGKEKPFVEFVYKKFIKDIK